MQAVIMAAGKGTRLRPLTYKKPKALLEIKKGVTILDRIIEALPDEIDEIILVVNHLAEQIKERYGQEAAGRKVKYVTQEKLDGSAKAVWACKDLLKDSFLVLNGDDIYWKGDLERLVKHELAVLAFLKEGTPTAIVKIDKKGDLLNIIDYPKVKPGKYLTNTGAYKLNQLFFDYEPVPMKKGSKEYGLPQTLARMARDQRVVVERAQKFLQVNSLDNLGEVREDLRKERK